MRVCLCKKRKVAKGGESEWVEGGVGREKKKVGGEPGGRVATHSGPSGGSAMRRVTLFLNGSPKNGKVRRSVGGWPPVGGEGSGARNGLAGQRAEVGERGWEVGVRRGGGRPGGECRVPAASSQAAGFLAGACPSTPPAALGASAGQLVLYRSLVQVWVLESGGLGGRGEGRYHLSAWCWCSSFHLLPEDPAAPHPWL